MKGLQLCEEFYYIHGERKIREHFPDAAERIAAGLAGPGSECFGFDDEISRDHDWGPGFCLWLTEEDYRTFGPALSEWYTTLPNTFRGAGPRITSPGEDYRTGISTITSFYRRFLGLDHPPETLREWMYLSEQALAASTNGKVFSDPLGEFSRWRNTLLRFYPEDVRLKKIASRCASIAQTGQYNYERSVKRGEHFAAHYSITKFCADSISLVFLLNKRYTPFYKWMDRGLRDLPLLGGRTHDVIATLIGTENQKETIDIIEALCAYFILELKRQGLTEGDSGFLLDHAYQVHGRIQDKELGRQFSVIS